jgi:murein DD-endopeptidase MepM/ murein hydrolase activator NlpD
MSEGMRGVGDGSAPERAAKGDYIRPPTTPLLNAGIAAHEVSFNKLAKDFDERYLGKAWLARADLPSPFLTPDVMQRAVDEYHARHGITWSFGGYLEDRTSLWRGSYLSNISGTFVHAGIDVNLPAQTLVRCTRGGVVRVVGDDCDTQGGWGPHVIVETIRNGAKEFVIYGHLGDVYVKEGDRLGPMSPIATTGGPPKNGGWWSHLHIQVIQDRYFMWCRRQGLMTSLDGYFEARAAEFYKPVFPDPIDLVWDFESDSSKR